jgi:hypothetical protein
MICVYNIEKSPLIYMRRLGHGVVASAVGAQYISSGGDCAVIYGGRMPSSVAQPASR